uniref:HECT domain-containing protein n=1 Tax=Ascaris lumbricoides TaxID=6252 RepID=A0A0M3HP77_ASCLU
MKIDADIVFVDADETLLLRSPLSDKFSIKLHSRMSLEMMKRNRTYGERICPFNETASECAQNSIGATRLGRNWKEIRQSMKLGIVRRATKTAAVMKKYRQRIMTTKSIDDALLFGELVNAVVLASKDELIEVIKEEDNQPILGILVNALGSAGTLLTHRFAREFLSNEEAQLAERYLESLALTTKINDVIIDDLKAWLAEENRSPSRKVEKEDTESLHEDGLDGNKDEEVKHQKQLKKHIAFALANLLRRRCESSTSRLYACNNGKDKDVNEFITRTTNCSDLHCQLNALQVLTNLRTAGVVPYADQFLCTNDKASQSLQKTALRLLSLVDFEFLDTSIIDRLLRIFRDACPLPQSTTDQTFATDVLMNTIPQRISVGTYLLRMESLKPDNHEKWAYFYDSVAQCRLVSEKVDDYWTRMRQFRVFKANYLHRSLLASSNVFGIKFAEKHNYGLQSLSKTEFNGGIFKRNDFLLSVKGPKDRHFPLFGITTDTAGLAEYLTESFTTDERSDPDEKSPEAAVQLSHFGAFLPPISVFEGYTELLGAVWNADGHTIDGHDVSTSNYPYFVQNDCDEVSGRNMRNSSSLKMCSLRLLTLDENLHFSEVMIKFPMLGVCDAVIEKGTS